MRKIEKLDEINKVERQLENSGYYVHSILSRYAERINQNEAFLFGLIDYLIEKTGVSEENLTNYVKNVKTEMKKKGELLNAGVALQIKNKAIENEYNPVNCDERMHICKAICCQLNFALTAKEIESGKLKWELGSPYYIRHEKTGFCSHLDPTKRCCTVYNNRPSICKRYSCANDNRIWENFDQMILNHKWINENLGEKKMRLESINMDQVF